MSIDYDAVSGFGYKISCEEYGAITFNAEDFDRGGCAELPKGFGYSQYGSAYGDGELGLLITINSDLSLILRGEEPLPDVSPILVWAKKYQIPFENDKPAFFNEIHIY